MGGAQGPPLHTACRGGAPPALTPPYLSPGAAGSPCFPLRGEEVASSWPEPSLTHSGASSSARRASLSDLAPGGTRRKGQGVVRVSENSPSLHLFTSGAGPALAEWAGHRGSACLGQPWRADWPFLDGTHPRSTGAGAPLLCAPGLPQGAERAMPSAQCPPIVKKEPPTLPQLWGQGVSAGEGRGGCRSHSRMHPCLQGGHPSVPWALSVHARPRWAVCARALLTPAGVGVGREVSFTCAFSFSRN